ncbi:PorT family protein [Flammeovirga sp. MY04]|uniref:porin family protein n=1 Tax=Flammeovirga sp. MY04 TaxID=1191459 RepID=UPI0008062B05|nr:porin family protein [Flammeovirga sp. MY04]ANQ48983.1 PorT family protein [Flammeovirga sp. MY04]
MKYYFLLVIAFLMLQNLQAQECEEAYNKANTFYTEGKLLQVPMTLQDCIDQGFESSSKQLNARRLVILSYLYSDNIEEAEIAMLALLKENSEYKPTSSDPAELRNLWGKFRTRPIMSFGVFGGATYNSANVSQTYGVGPEENHSEVEYKPNLSFKVGVSYNYFLSNNVQINISPSYESVAFQTEENPLDISESLLKETQSFIDMPLAIRFVLLPNKKLRPFIGVGGSAKLLLNASIEGEMVYESPDVVDIEATPIDITKQRKNLMYGAMLQAGFYLKTRYSHWTVMASYYYALQNFNNPNNRYDNNELIFNYGYVDNDVRMDILTLTVGISIDFYRPKIYRKYRSID